MFLVLLRFGPHRERAPLLMSAHNAWIAKGLEDKAFLLVGTLVPQAGGILLVQGKDRAMVETRLAADPFVSEGVVTPEIVEFTPGRADERLSFLLA